MRKNRTSNGYVKDSEYVEVGVKRAAPYADVASTAKAVVGLQMKLKVPCASSAVMAQWYQIAESLTAHGQSEPT